MQEEIRNPEEATSKKAQKTPKEQKPPKLLKQQKTPLPKPDKKTSNTAGKKTSGAAVMCVFLVVFMIAGVSLIYFNVGGAGAAVVDMLQSNLPVEENAIEGPTAQELEQKQAELNKLEETLEKTKQKLDKKDNELSALEKELAEREQALAEKEAGFEAESAEVYALIEQQKELKSTAEIFEKMDPQKAADVIGKLKSVPSIVELLKAMSKDKAANILANMEPALATKVLSEMMK